MKYKLLQKWPDSEIGDIFQWNGQGYSNQTRTALVVSKNYVEKYPAFFEVLPVSEPVKERYEIGGVWRDTEFINAPKYRYMFYVDKRHNQLSEEQFEQVRLAIENILNFSAAS